MQSTKTIYLRDEITNFLNTQPQKFSKLDDSYWNEDLFFLCDITSHLDNLTIKLQGKGKLIFDPFAAINAFKAKLTLFNGHFL